MAGVASGVYYVRCALSMTNAGPRACGKGHKEKRFHYIHDLIDTHNAHFTDEKIYVYVLK